MCAYSDVNTNSGQRLTPLSARVILLKYDSNIAVCVKIVSVGTRGLKEHVFRIPERFVKGD